MLKKISKVLSFILLLQIVAAACFAQNQPEYEFVSLAQNQKLYLNSQGRIGGTTKSSIYINLPANTVQWGYMLTTTKSAVPPILNLLGQLSSIYDHSGISSAIFSMVTCPTGESTVNAYLIKPDERSNFENTPSFRYFPPASRKAFNSGPVKIDQPLCSGDFYIGIENPAMITGVTVILDAVAIVRKQKPQANIIQSLLENMNKPKDSATVRIEAARDSVTRAERSATNYGNLGWSAYERGDINASIQHSLKSIGIHPMFYVKANLGLCYLTQGKDDLALDAYITGLDLLQNESGKRSSLKGAISELEKAKAKGGLSGMADDILSMLRLKL